MQNTAEFWKKLGFSHCSSLSPLMEKFTTTEREVCATIAVLCEAVWGNKRLLLTSLEISATKLE